METMNITAVETATETTTTSASKHKWLSKFTRASKKATMFATIAGIMAMTGGMQALVLSIREVLSLLRVPFSRALSVLSVEAFRFGVS